MVFMAARAAADEIAMFGGIDLQCHSCSLEIVDVMRAVLPAALRGAERGIRMPRRPSRRDRPRQLTTSSAGTARSRGIPGRLPAAASTASCWLPRYSLPRRTASCCSCAAVRVDFAAVLGVPEVLLLPLVTAPIRIVARWRTRTVRRVLLRLLRPGDRATSTSCHVSSSSSSRVKSRSRSRSMLLN